jgi:hypothetical protein
LSSPAKKISPAFDDVASVRAEIVDANGVEIPRASDLISFKISGPGVIAAVDNGDNSESRTFSRRSDAPRISRPSASRSSRRPRHRGKSP